MIEQVITATAAEYSAWADLFQKFGALVILAYLAVKLSNWMPAHFKAEGERRDKMLEIFKEESAAERARCDIQVATERARSDAQIVRVFEYATGIRAEILRAIEGIER